MDNDNNIINFDKEVDVDKTKFVIDFNMSYMDYCNAHSISTPSLELMDAWASSLRDHYQLKASEEEVMMFFRIPEKFREKIKNKQYSVSDFIKHNDTTNKVLIIVFTLTINEQIILPKGMSF